MFIRVIFPLI